MVPRIDRVGYEIEAGWLRGNPSNELLGWSIVHDGTIRAQNDAEKKYSFYEARSPAYKKLKGALAGITNAPPFIGNSSTGFHVHLSFIPRIPALLWSREFVLDVERAIAAEFPEAWSMRARNRFCRSYGRAIGLEAQITRRHGKLFEKYRSVNILRLQKFWDSQQTVEFRIFPTTTKREMRRYVRFVYEWTRAYLRNKQVCRIARAQVDCGRRVEKVVEGVHMKTENVQVTTDTP